MSIDEKAVGARIKERREKAALTRKELGARVGLSWQSIRNIEDGRNIVQWRKLAEFAETLGATPNEILLGRR